MPTAWHYKSLGQEFGPVSFRDLTRMVRDGELAADDQVRSEFSDRWQWADEVPGLFHMAHVPEAEPETDEQRAGEWDELEVVSEADLEELLPSEERPAWMKRILVRLWGGETVSDSDRERVLGFLRSEGDTGSADETEVAATEDDASDSVVAGGATSGSALEVGEDFYGEAQPPSSVGTLLAEMEEAHESEVAAAQANKRRWRFSLKEVASDRLLWTQMLRVGGAMLCANLIFLWLESWNARQALRFPGLVQEQSARMFPVIGTCSPTEYWFFAVDLAIVAAGLGYAAVRWVQLHLD